MISLQPCWECVTNTFHQNSIRSVWAQMFGFHVFLKTFYNLKLLNPQMTQKDIAFVADFLSEHFSEVSGERAAAPFKLWDCFEEFYGFNRTRSSLIVKGNTSTWSELVRYVMDQSAGSDWMTLLADCSFVWTFTVSEGWGWRPHVSPQHQGEPVAEVFRGELAPERSVLFSGVLQFFVGTHFLRRFCNLLPLWLTFAESPLLFPSYPQKSLHFVKRMMEGVIQHCLQKPAVGLKRPRSASHSCPSSEIIPSVSLAGGHWEICEASCFCAPVHCAREVTFDSFSEWWFHVTYPHHHRFILFCSSENTPRLFELPSL